MSDRNVDAVEQKLLERSKSGIETYGCTTERTDLTKLQWLEHLQEELLDAAVYAERLKQEEVQVSDDPKLLLEQIRKACALTPQAIVDALTQLCAEEQAATDKTIAELRAENERLTAEAKLLNHENELLSRCIDENLGAIRECIESAPGGWRKDQCTRAVEAMQAVWDQIIPPAPAQSGETGKPPELPPFDMASLGIPPDLIREKPEGQTSGVRHEGSDSQGPGSNCDSQSPGHAAGSVDASVEQSKCNSEVERLSHGLYELSPDNNPAFCNNGNAVSDALKWIKDLQAAFAESQKRLDFLKSKGISVGLMKESGKEPYLAYDIASGSELDDTPAVLKLVDVEVELAKTQKQLADAKSLLSTEKEVREATDRSLFNLAAYVSHESNYNMPMSGHAISARNCIKQLRDQLAASEASAAALRAALKRYNDAAQHWKDNYEKELERCEAKAKQLEAEGDLHGVNFFKGKWGGIVHTDISLTKLKDAVTAAAAMAEKGGE